MEYYIYILECKNGSYYTGYTVDIQKRYQQHVDGVGAKYTRSFPPKKIAVYWVLSLELSMILKIEYKIKTLKKVEKKRLIQEPDLLETLLHQLSNQEKHHDKI